MYSSMSTRYLGSDYALQYCRVTIALFCKPIANTLSAVDCVFLMGPGSRARLHATWLHAARPARRPRRGFRFARSVCTLARSGAVAVPQCGADTLMVSPMALLMGAQIKSRMEECALDMVLRSNDAAMKGVKILLSMEEYALSMGQSSEDVAMMDAQI